MLIARDFVFIHQPKTGGHFVREALYQIGRTELNEGPIGLLKRHGILSSRYQSRQVEPYHGTCHDIPERERGKPVVSIVRNPFDFYVSFYHFGWWATHPEDSYPEIQPVLERFPHFPNLSFEEFLDVANMFFNEYRMIGADRDPVEQRLGYYSTQFILYYFRVPKASYRRIASGAGSKTDSKEAMFNVEFLRTSSLNQDLVEFLRRQNYPARLLTPIMNKKPVRPGEPHMQRLDRDHRNYYDDRTREIVRRKDQLIFSLFPEFDF